MSKFYGTVQGNRGEATRCGHSTIRASAQSHEGSIVTTLLTIDNVVMCSIIAENGSKSRPSITGTMLYYGPLADLLSHEGHSKLIEMLAHEKLERQYAKGA